MHQVLPPSPGLDLFSVTICKSKHNAHPLRRNQHTRFHYKVCLWYQFHRCISDLTELSLQPRECLTLFSLAQRTPGPLWAASHRDPPLLWRTPLLFWASCHSDSLCFCCLHSREACGCVSPKRLCFQFRGLPPLSLIMVFGSGP